MVDQYAALDAFTKGHDIEKVKYVVATLVQERGITSVTPDVVSRSVIDNNIRNELIKDKDQGWFTSSSTNALVMYENCYHIVVIKRDAAAVRKCPSCHSSHTCQASDTLVGLWVPVNDLPDPVIEQFVFHELHAAQNLVTRSIVLPKSCLKHELMRLMTFMKYRPKGTPDYVRLAVAGFFSTNSNEMACYVCGLIISTWKSNKCPIVVHQICSPTCEFLRKNDTVNIAVFDRNATEDGILNRNNKVSMLNPARIVERLHFDNVSAFTQLFCLENKLNVTTENVKLGDSTLNSVGQNIVNDDTSHHNIACICENDHTDPKLNNLSRDSVQQNKTNNATSKMLHSPVEHALSDLDEVDFRNIFNSNASPSKLPCESPSKLPCESPSKLPCENDDDLPSLIDQSMTSSDYGSSKNVEELQSYDDLRSREVSLDFEHNAASCVIRGSGYSVQKVRTAITVMINNNITVTSKNILNVLRAANDHGTYKNNGLFICIGDTVCIIFDTCGHLASCRKSDPAIRQCPVCVNHK